MAGERREADYMNKSLDEIAAEMDSGLYEREDRESHHRQQRRYSPYPSDHGPSWRAERDNNNGLSAASTSSGGGGGDATKVFIANLNYTVTWQRVKDIMKDAGPVIKIDLFKHVDGTSRGMGLVVFADRESADRAVRDLNGTELDGRKIFLRKDMRVEDREKSGMASIQKPRPHPNPSTTVFVANLDYSLTWQKLRDILRVAGKILHVEMMTDSDGKSKGCASVQFETTAQAVNAIILFHGQLLQNRPMIVRMDSKSSFQPDPIQLKLKGGVGGGMGPGPAGMGVVGGASGMGLASPLPSHHTGSTGSLARLMGNLPLHTGGHTANPLNPAALSSPALSNQLPLLAALGLSALTNLRHFNPDQLTLLGINPAHVPGNSGGISGDGSGGRGLGGANASPSLLGHRASAPLSEQRQDGGLLSQLPFFLSQESSGGLPDREKDGSLSLSGGSLSLSGLLAPHPPPPISSPQYGPSMATNLSLSTALALPNHPTSLMYSRPEPLMDVGRKGKRLFVRNLSFTTTWQALKDHLKAGTGPISYVDLMKNPEGTSRGCAAVVFEHEDDAEMAIRMYNQSLLDGRRISIVFDRAN